MFLIMLIVTEQNDTPRQAVYQYCEFADGVRLRYLVGDDEYVYQDDRIILLLDTTHDRSCRNLVQDLGQSLSNDLASDCLIESLPLEPYFAIVVDKRLKRVLLLRDISGIKTGYYFAGDGFLCVGNNVHQVALQSQVTEFDDDGIYQVLYLNYLYDGYTYYRGVREVLIGETITFDQSPSVIGKKQRQLSFANADNGFSFEENVKLLHQKIVIAHERQAGLDNVVLLSGGLDSAVMLVALLEVAPGRVRALSFRVEGTQEDETVYARSLAEHLGVDCQYTDVDPENESVYAGFEDQILSMNNPYPGLWIFGNLGAPTRQQTYFAGQDTRLHTPDLNFVDKLAFGLLPLWKRQPSRTIMQGIHRAVSSIRPGRMSKSESRSIRGISRAIDTLDLSQYFRHYFFHCYSEVIPPAAHSQAQFEAIERLFSLDLGRVSGQRQLYNEIVRLKWREQYTHDIRYLQDVAKLRGTYISMPFYDPELSEFSSSIPFKQATRFLVGRDRYTLDRVLVNKYMLRMAFRERLNDKIFYRQKAVSSSMYLLCNGALGRIVADILSRDLSSSNSFLRQFNLQPMADRFLKHEPWAAADEAFLLKIYIFATLCIYKHQVLNNSARQKSSGVRTS
jgi:asparagine synthetase B (glutamine-hydrolysing)